MLHDHFCYFIHHTHRLMLRDTINSNMKTFLNLPSIPVKVQACVRKRDIIHSRSNLIRD